MTDQARYGWMAEFRDVDALCEAVRRLREAGMQLLTAHTPFAVPELDDVLPPPRRRVVPWAAFAGGLCGGLGTLAMEYWSAVVDYPVRICGRPYASWNAFIPPALEMTLLFTAGFGVLAMLIANRLPCWYHPVFNVPGFALASQDMLAVVVLADDPRCKVAFLDELVDDLDPIATHEVMP